MSSKSENKMNIKFIHASDIHLGSHQIRNDERANDFLYAFEEILNIAKHYRVNFIILAGDIFTSLEILPEKFTTIIKIIRKFKQSTPNTIPIIAIEGNHDIRKYSRGKRFQKEQSWLKVLNELELIILLDADFNNGKYQLYKEYNTNHRKGGKISLKNTIIYGNCYIGQNPVEYIRKISNNLDDTDDKFKILIQHFGIKGEMENVPGIAYRDIACLREKVDYLALGHFHKQFIINNWVFNPGSSEATCVSDHFFKRGIFLVKAVKNKKNKYKIRASSIELTNRKSIWNTISLKSYFNNFQSLINYIIKSLTKQRNPRLLDNHPILYLRLTGIKPMKLSKKRINTLSNYIIKKLGYIDVKIYQKFNKNIQTIDAYLS
jgi:DNA repair exonuclease SbcCD nuclease subunit